MLNTTLNFVYFFVFLSCAWLGQKDSTFWSVTQSLLVGEQAGIRQIEEEIHAFHMSPKAQQMIKKPANSGLSLIHSCSCLVYHGVDFTVCLAAVWLGGWNTNRKLRPPNLALPLAGLAQRQSGLSGSEHAAALPSIRRHLPPHKPSHSKITISPRPLMNLESRWRRKREKETETDLKSRKKP